MKTKLTPEMLKMDQSVGRMNRTLPWKIKLTPDMLKKRMERADYKVRSKKINKSLQKNSNVAKFRY